VQNLVLLNLKITIEGISTVGIVTPKEKIVQSFIEITRSFYNQVDNLYKISQNLRRTRDLLLPKLVSGEIEV